MLQQQHNAAMPHNRHSQASGHDVHASAIRHRHYRAHHLNKTSHENTSSSVSHDAAPTPQVGLPPGLLVRAADGRLAPRAGANTQCLDRVQVPARTPDISPGPAGRTTLTSKTMSDMLNRSIQELLMTHSRTDFLQSVQVTLSASEQKC